MKNRFTARFFNAHFARASQPLSINLSKSRLPDEDSVISENQELFLNCQIHGELDEPTHKRALARHANNKEQYKKSHCNGCNVENELAPIRWDYAAIAAYVNSEERLRTHYARFELVDSKEELKIKNRLKFDIKVRYLTAFGKIKEGEERIIQFKKFRDASHGVNEFSNNISWCHRFLIAYLRAYDVEFLTEYSFSDLKTQNNIAIQVDIYVPVIKTIIEINGGQHYSKDLQIKRDSKGKVSKYTSEESFKKQQGRDEKLKKYVEQDSNLRLLNVPIVNQKPSNKSGYANLNKQKQHKLAIQTANKTYRKINQGAKPPQVSDSRIIALLQDPILLPDLESRHKEFLNTYKLSIVDAKHAKHRDMSIIFECKRSKPSHYFVVSRGTLYSWQEKNKDSSNEVCYGCIIDNKIKPAVRACKKYKVTCDELDGLSTIYQDSENPKLKPDAYGLDKKELVLKFKNETQKINLAVLLKQDAEDYVKRFKEKAQAKINKEKDEETREQEKTFMDDFEKESVAFSEEAKLYNLSLLKGELLSLPSPPSLQFNKKTPPETKQFKVVQKHFKSNAKYKVHSTSAMVRKVKNFVMLQHEACGTIFFVTLRELVKKIKNKNTSCCLKRECFQKNHKLKLAKSSSAPSRAGISPSNKDSFEDKQQKVSAISQGYFKLASVNTQPKPCIIVEVTKNGMYRGTLLQYSTLDNFLRRSYLPLIKALNEDRLPFKAKVVGQSEKLEN